jgi:hypothetical protein
MFTNSMHNFSNENCIISIWYVKYISLVSWYLWIRQANIVAFDLTERNGGR